MASLIHPDDQKSASAIFKELTKTEWPHVAEGKYRLKDKSGKWRWFLDRTIATRYDSEGKIEEIVGIATEIITTNEPGKLSKPGKASELSKASEPPEQLEPTKTTAESQITEAHDMLYTLLQETLEAVPLAICWKDAESTYQGCNSQFLNIAGLPSDTDIRQKADHDLPWKDTLADTIRKADREVIKSGHPKTETIKAQDTSGDVNVDLKSTRIPLVNSAGKTNGILWVLERAIETAIPSTLLEFLPAKLALLDEDGFVVQANRLWRDFFDDKKGESQLFSRIKRRNKITLERALKDAAGGKNVEVKLNFTSNDDHAVKHHCVFAPSPLEDNLIQCLAIAEEGGKTARERKKN